MRVARRTGSQLLLQLPDLCAELQDGCLHGIWGVAVLRGLDAHIHDRVEGVGDAVAGKHHLCVFDVEVVHRGGAERWCREAKAKAKARAESMFEAWCMMQER